MSNKKINPFIYFLISIIYLEILTKGIITKQIFNIGLLNMLIFTIPLIILFTIFTKSFNRIINKINLFLITIILTIYFEVQYIFYILFSVPFSFNTIGLANQAMDFTSIIKDAIVSHLPVFIAILIPFITLIIIARFIDTNKYSKESKITLLIMFITSYLSTFIFLLPITEETKLSNDLYYKRDDAEGIISRFGLLTYTKIDIKRQVLGYENDIIVEEPPAIPEKEEPTTPQEIVYKDNVIDINFEEKKSNNKNINNLNKYFQNQIPTKQNEYTGMFKGKNLIFILAEGFNEIAVDETRTPTLYNMIHQGFYFDNFYSPVFLSTTGGEFQATTGLIPTQEILRLWKTKEPKLSFALGHALGNIGYRTQSYHNWTHTYYKRHVTMPTLGFNHYLGCGNGIEKRMNCKWLPKDTDLINVTTPEYLGKEGNFVTYYVTVSGHSPYNSGHNIARLHKDSVKDLPYTNPVKYYMASQVELDKMLELLVEKLTESGELENTVIALVGDHYPYTLSTKEMNEAATYEKDGTIEVNRSNFLLWNSEMTEPINVHKVGSQIDVLPTLLNLFGVEYDSRMIIGKDILSEYEGIAIFSNRSWVSDYGTYDVTKHKFIPKEGMPLVNETEKDYVRRMNNRVSNSFSISKLLVDNDYYKYILK